MEWGISYNNNMTAQDYWSDQKYTVDKAIEHGKNYATTPEEFKEDLMNGFEGAYKGFVGGGFTGLFTGNPKVIVGLAVTGAISGFFKGYSSYYDDFFHFGTEGSFENMISKD